MPRVDEFYAAVRDPLSYVEKLKNSSGQKVIGYLCSYAPEEIICAAGAHPLRLFARSGQVRLADAHLQAYCCALARGILDEALAGRLSSLDGVVFPHTCDTMQRLSDIWRLNIRHSFHCDVVLPVKMNSDSAADYLRDVLKRFRNELAERLGVDIDNEKLRAAIRTCNRIRSALARIYAVREQHPQLFRGEDLYTVVKAAMVMERTRLAETLSQLADELENMQRAVGNSGERGKRVFLSGGLCDYPNVYTIIENAGGVVVGDDLCTGSRYFHSQVGETGEPLVALAARYLQRAPCPAKHMGITTRGETLVQAVQQKRAQGVVFFQLKFCDPHAFDYPYLKQSLEREKIPSLLLEVDQQGPVDGQLRTRLESFLEMI